jgi:hypothetical protein
MNVNEKDYKFNQYGVKLFTEILNDLRFPLLNEVYNNEPLEKEKLFEEVLFKCIEKDFIHTEKDKLLNKLENAYENLIKNCFIEVNSDNKIKATKRGKILVELYYDKPKYHPYQYDPEKDDYVPVKNFFEYRNGKRIIPTDQELMNIYVLFRGSYNNHFLNSVGEPCSLRDATLFDDYNKAYEFLRERSKNNSSEFNDVHVFSIYELNTTTEYFGIRKFEDGSKLVNKNAFLTVLNGHLATYEDAKKFIL